MFTVYLFTRLVSPIGMNGHQGDVVERPTCLQPSNTQQGKSDLSSQCCQYGIIITWLCYPVAGARGTDTPQGDKAERLTCPEASNPEQSKSDHFTQSLFPPLSDEGS